MQEFYSVIRSRQPVNLIIVAVNVIVFAALCFMGDTENVYFMLDHGAAFGPMILENGEYYRLVTSMFLHFGIEHLFYNMLILVFLGDSLEKEVGKLRYLIIYMGGGIAGNVLSVLVEMRTEEYAVSAGASGAIFAVIGALIWIVLRNKGRLEDYSGKRLLFMAALSVAQGLTATGVDNWAHIGGLAGGFLLSALLYRRGRRRQKSV